MTTTGNERHLRMMILLVKGGTEMTKRLFEKRVEDLKPINHDPNTPWTVDVFLYQNKTSILSSKKGREKENVYFPGPCDKTDLSKWDLIMFCFILTRICSLSNSRRKDIEELREMRNKISHVTDPTLEESKFEKKLRNFRVIAENICKEINDVSFEKHINELIDNIKTDPLSTSDIVKMTHKFYTMERENKAILTEHTKDHKEMIERLTRIESKLDNTSSSNAVKLPETDVEILVQNCNKDKEKKLSQILVKLIDEKIKERTDLVEELSNQDMAKLREAVAEAVEMFLTNGRKITSTENKCVLLRVQCLSVGSLAALFRDCISGELTAQLKPIETAIRGLKGYEEVYLEAIIYEDEFWKVMSKTTLEDYIQAEENKPRAVVSMQYAQAASSENEGTPLTLNIHYPSSVQRDILREAFTKGEIDRRMKNIQDAVGPEYSNVKITARLKKQVELSPEVYYANTKRCTKRVKKKKNSKGTKGTLSEMVSSMMISKSDQKTKEITVDFNSSSGKMELCSFEDVTSMVIAEDPDFSIKAAQVLSSFRDQTSDPINDSGTEMIFSHSDSDSDKENIKLITAIVGHTENESLDSMPYISETKQDINSRSNCGISSELSPQHKNSAISNESDLSVVQEVYSPYDFIDIDADNDSGIGTGFPHTESDSDTSTQQIASDAECEKYTEHENSNASGSEGNEEIDFNFECDVKGDHVQHNENNISVIDEDSIARKNQHLLEHGIKLNDSYMAQFRAKTAKHGAFYEQFFDEQTLNKLLASQPDKFIRGIIYLEGAHEAVCVPTHLQYNFEVHISGRSKIGQAYNQDEVVVELLDKKEKKEIRFGKVVGVLNRQKSIKHPVFLCTPDDVESHIVRPMCKTVPKIHVIQDKLKQTRTNPRARKNRIEIYEYFEQAEILCDSRIEELLPTEIESCVFLVALISWELNQIYPRGAIIRKFPRGDTIETGLTILNLRYGIMSQLNGDDQLSPYELNESEEIKRKNLTHLDTFTIDRRQCKDFNYAFSVENEKDGYIVGVHVVDVAAYVTKGSPLDQNAQKLSRTICSDVGEPRYMLPVDIAENTCSLTKDETRPTISFFCFLGENGRQMQIEGRTFKMENTFIKCRKNFSYAEALQIVEKVDNDDMLSFSLKRIFGLMKQRRTQRLGVSMYTLCDYEINKDEKDKGSVLAQCIVEELVIMVNEQVARVLDRNQICLPFYIESGPSANDSEKFLHKYKDYINVVVKLQQKEIVTSRRVSLEDIITSNSETDVMETRSLWERMKTIQLETARCNLLDDNIHPLQCVIYQEWLSIQQKPCYVNSNIEHAKNLSIGVEKYTHCTSPSRRYTDLVVQRLLHAYMGNQRSPYSEQEISSICLQSNSALNATSDYERDIRSLTAAVRLKSETNFVTCFVKEVSDKNVTVTDTSDYSSRKQALDISFNLLDMGYKPVVSLDVKTNWTKVKGIWRKRFYDMKKYVLQDLHVPKSKLFVPRKQTVSPEKRVEALDPNRNVVFIKLNQYAGLLKSASTDHIQDLKRKLRRTIAKEKPDGVEDVSTELTDHSEIMANTKFSHTFFLAQPVIIQLTSEPHQGIIRPKPMVFQMTKTINLCLLHTEDPVLHLEHYETRLTQDQYNSVQHYSDTWLPIVLMEASNNAIGNEDSCNINNITLQCITNQTGSFQLPMDFCEERNIRLSGTVYKIESDDDDSKHSYDWLCIKYTMNGYKTEAGEETDASVWIGHARITEIIEIAQRKLSVKFQLHELANKFPHEMLKLGNATVSVEVLSKTDVDRRIESYLRRFCLLEDMKEPLSVKIALKKKFHVLDKAHRKVAEIIERDLYFSVASDDPRRRPLPRNNTKQQEAIDYALRNRFTLIQGPPGTGKTYTGIKLIYLFNKINNILSKEGNVHKQVLFCGPSNKSVDLVAKWMLRRLGNYCPDFVRVYGKATESLDFPIPGVSYSSRGSAVHRADEELQDVTLHFLIRRRGNKYAKEINETDTFFKQFQQTSSNESKQSLREECTRRQLNEKIKEYKKIVNKASKEELKKHRVILCTTGVGSNPVILQAADIYQVIVDEAGMCPEPQCMVPLIATKAEQVVLIGDHKQLRPIVKCKAAAELGLDKSLFERYATMKDCPAPFIMLDEQYRMNPELCEFPSKQFYDGKLMTMPGLWKKGDVLQIWPKDSNIKKKSYPHILIHIEGEEQVLTVHTDEGNEQSRSNSKEIKKVLKVYRYFIEEGVGAHSINIISQYNAQCAAIREELEKQGFTNYLVNTVVSSQGGEWDYVIFSTVRSLPQYKIELNSTLGWRKHNLGFITDKNQINVALTRARKGLIIIGNKNLLSCDPVWKKLVSHYEQRECVKLPKDFPPPPRSRQQRLQDSQKRSRELFGEDIDDEQF